MKSFISLEIVTVERDTFCHYAARLFQTAGLNTTESFPLGSMILTAVCHASSADQLVCVCIIISPFSE